LIWVSLDPGGEPALTVIPRRHMNSLIVDQKYGAITSDTDFVPGEVDVTVDYEGHSFKLPSGQNTTEVTVSLLGFLPSLLNDRKRSTP
jgi:hypothetical protein